MSISNIRNEPLVSVVMATYNGQQFIKEAIQSILDQTFVNFELIIVDDGSTDATAHIINSFNDDRIYYIKKEKNSGIADSLNIGVLKARGKFVARMDDDDLCLGNRFEEQIKVLEENSNIILCGSSVLIKNGSLVKWQPQFHEDIKMSLLFYNPIVHPAVMIRKEVLLVNMYNPEKVPSEDYDLWSRLIFEGEFYQIQKPLLFYRFRQDSETSTRRKEQLQLNVAISKFVFEKSGFSNLINKEENIRIIASRDYSISGKKLNGLIEWFDKLKLYNAEKKIFSNEKFNHVTDTNLKQFVISFFSNKKLVNKIIPFLNLNGKLKIYVFKYYFNKFFLKTKNM